MVDNPSETTTSDARLTLVTLGGWGLFAPGSAGLTPQLGPSKPLALLVYLALSPGRTAAREHLLDLLWADLDPSAATHAYRQTVWYIRRRIGDDCLVTGSGSLCLACPVETDREAFLTAVEAQDLENAVHLYRGDFLPGFAAPGGAEFEKWADLERYRLRRLFIRCASQLARQRLEAGHAREAVALARRVRDTDRDSEAGWRLYLEALASSGDALTAAVEADQLERFLASESIEPDPATRSALRLARQQPRTETETAAATLVAELVGREKEFGAIVGAWDAVRRGTARHIHLLGTAGHGKSRLLADAYARLRASGARSVLLRATPGERTLSYAFTSDLATALAELSGASAVSTETAGTLVALSPSLAARFPSAVPDRSTGDEAARRRLLAIVELVAAVADEAPLALLLDDIHWADTSSRHLLTSMLGRLHRHPVLVVSTARPVPEGAFEHPDSEQFVLEPLTAPQVSAFVASLGALPEEPWTLDLAARLCSATHGSPLTLLETLQLGLERGVLTLAPEGWCCEDPEVLDALLASGAALRIRLEQLGRDQRWLLLLLATHGAPLAWDQVQRAAPRSNEALQSDLAALEQRGLVSRPHGHWQPAHDTIAEMACELAGEEAMRAAHAALGRAVEVAATDDHLVLPRAAQHYAAAGEDAALGRAFRRWVRTLRRQGDRRPPVVLAQDLLGTAASGQVPSLVRSLPFHVRFGLDQPRRAFLVAGLAVLLLAGAWTGLRPSSEPDATLEFLSRDSSGVVRMQEQPIFRSRWAPGLNFSAGGGRRAAWPARNFNFAAYLPAGAVFTTVGEFPDSGGQDALVSSDLQHWTRLAAARGDDYISDESPDGRYLLLVTARWNARSLYDIAVFDRTTGQVRSLTRSDNFDFDARWSPDGTRIAFVRRRLAALRLDTAETLCMVAPFGGDVACLPTLHEPINLVGWLDAERLLIQFGRSGILASYEPKDGVRKVIRRALSTARLSPDAEWIACPCVRRADGSTAWIAFPSDRPDLPAIVTVPPGASLIAFWGRGKRRPYVARLVGTSPAESIGVGVPHQLTVTAVMSDGSTRDDVPLRWSSSEPSMISVDDSGNVVAQHLGTAIITASAGGWRTTRIAVKAAASVSRPLMSESWRDGLDLWRPFGDPRPQLVTARDGVRAFFNAGDGSFVSGAWTNVEWQARGGLGVEAAVETPIDSAQWQSVALELTAGLDTLGARTWDDKVDIPPGFGSTNPVVCGLAAPAGEGVSLRDSATARAGNEGMTIRSRGLRDGRWHRIRAQILFDGRCGVAIDGRAIWISRAHLRTDVGYRVVTYGNSAWTRILVGPLQVWQGVRSDVDWTSLTAEAAGPTAAVPSASRRAAAAPPRAHNASRAALSPAPSGSGSAPR